MENIKLYTLDNVPDYLKEDKEIALSCISYFIDQNMDVSDLEKVKKLFNAFNQELNDENMSTMMMTSFGKLMTRDRYIKQLQDSKELKYFVKNIQRDLKNVSFDAATARKHIAAYIGNIIHQAGLYAFQDIFKILGDEVLIYFSKSLEGEVNLNEEFHELINKTVFDFFSKSQNRRNTKYYQALSDSYSYLHAEFLVKCTQENIDIEKLKQIKEKVNILFTEGKNTVIANAQERQNDFNKSVENLTADLFENTGLKSGFKNFIDNLKKEEYLERNKECIRLESRKDAYQDSRIEETFKKYFYYEGCTDEYKDNYYKSAKGNVKFNEFCKMKDYQDNMLSYSISLIDTSLFDESIKDYENEEDKAQFLTVLGYTFYSFWANFLMWGTETEYDEVRTNKLLDIFEKHDCCKEAYHLFRSNSENENLFFLKTYASKREKIEKIASILLTLDNKNVAKALKAIIVDDNKKFLNEDVQKEYPNIKNINMVDNLDLFIGYNSKMYEENNSYCPGHMADEFTMAYFQDKVYIAPYTAFVRWMNKSINEILELQPYLQFLENGIQKDGEEFIENDKTKEVYREIVATIDNDDASYSGYLRDIVDSVIRMYCINTTFFVQTNEWALIEQYKNKIIATLISNKNNKFLSLNYDGKVNVLFIISVLHKLLEELIKDNLYLPGLVSLENEKVVKELEETITDLQHLIIEKEKIINSNEENLKKVERDIKDKANRNNAKAANEYKKEIASLNKDIKDKDARIEELENEREELLAIRDMFFELKAKEEDIEEVVENIDLSEISNKYKICIIGGHYKVTDRLKAKYPNLHFIEDDLAKEDVVRNSDYVFFVWKWISHTMYYKYVTIVREYNIPFDYLMNTNIEKIESHIYNFITKGSN